MRRWKNVGVSRDNECRGRDPANLLREIEVLLHRLADLAEQSAPILRSRRQAGIELVHRRLLHSFGRRGADLSLLRKYVGVESVSSEWRRHDDQFTDDLGVSDRRLQGDASAE